MANKPEEPKKKKKKVAGPKKAKGGNEDSVKRVRAIFGQVALGLLALSGWMILMMKTPVESTGKASPPDPAGGSYVLSYFLVLMGTALGLLAVCRPSGRRDRAGNAQYGEGDREKMLAEGLES
jgi:hypothetical protein